MPPAVIHPKDHPATADRRRLAAVALLVALQLAAAGLLIWSEADLAARVAFVLTWGLLNFFWLVLLRRPLTAAVVSLGLIVILILLSQFKHAVLMMTATFVDVMIIDLATFSFLLAIIPGLAWKVGLALMLAIPVLLAAWRADPFRVPRGRALLGCLGCLGDIDRLVLRLSVGPGGRVLSPPIRLQIRAVGFSRHRRSDRPRRARGRRCRCRSAVSGPGRCVRCGPEVAAYRQIFGRLPPVFSA